MYTLLVGLLAVGLATMGCSESIDEEDDDSADSSESLHVEPDLIEDAGGKTCRDVGLEENIDGAEYWLDCKIEFNGVTLDEELTYPNADGFETNHEECAEILEVVLEIYDEMGGHHFDWVSNIGIAAVLVKGGPDANFYHYDPPETEDEELRAPDNPGGNIPDLSHVSFCVAQQLDVEKDATGTFVRTHDWGIDKVVDPASWDLFDGDTGESEYDVEVDAGDPVDSNFEATGEITIENNMLADAEIASVTDEVNGVAADVDCGEIEFPYTLEAGEELICTYVADMGDEDPGEVTNVATVEVTAESPIAGDTAEANVTFEPTEVDETITVDDSVEGELGTCSAEDAPCEFSYERVFECPEDAGTHDNTAEIRETGDDAMAAVDVACYGLQISQIAPGTDFVRQYLWDIDKSAWPTSVVADGQDHDVEYTIAVDLDDPPFEETSFGVDAVFAITIENPNPELGALVTDLSHQLELADGTIVTDTGLSCVDSAEMPVTVPQEMDPGEQWLCSYAFDFDENPCPENGAQCESTLVAELQNFAFEADTSATEIGTTDFSNALMFHFDAEDGQESDVCVDITDTNEQFAAAHGSPEVCFDDTLPAEFTYTRTFNLSAEMTEEECAAFVHENVATATAQDSLRQVTDDAVVTCEDVVKPPKKDEEEKEEKKKKDD